MSLLLVAGIIMVFAVACTVSWPVACLGLQVGLTSYGPVLIVAYFAYRAVASLPASAVVVLTVLTLLVVNDYWSRVVARVEYTRIVREKLQRRVLDRRDQHRRQQFAS